MSLNVSQSIWETKTYDNQGLVLPMIELASCSASFMYLEEVGPAVCFYWLCYRNHERVSDVQELLVMSVQRSSCGGEPNKGWLFVCQREWQIASVNCTCGLFVEFIQRPIPFLSSVCFSLFHLDPESFFGET